MRATCALLLATAGALGCAGVPPRSTAPSTTDFAFESSGRMLSGVVDQPADGAARALVVFVHGSGPTDVRGRNSFSDLRRRFAALGIASAVWDKPGRGRSAGTFDDNQPIEESAREVLDAVAALRARRVPGATHIGIWSTSRGSWVAPIALARDARLRFWITVSGGPAEDNKYYILSANLPLEGRSPAETRRLLEEWVRGRRIFAAGGSYEAYLQATEALRRDPAVRYLAGDLTAAADAYQAEQRAYLARKEAYPLDERTMSIIRVPGLAGMLQAIAIDALALFGENDTNADWRGGRTLYESTIGRNPKATLEVRTFPGCNHAINPSKTGSIREVEATPLEAGPKCEGYYETQIDWLRRRVVRP